MAPSIQPAYNFCISQEMTCFFLKPLKIIEDARSHYGSPSRLDFLATTALTIKNETARAQRRAIIEGEVYDSLFREDWKECRRLFRILVLQHGEFKIDVIRLLVSTRYMTVRNRNTMFRNMCIPKFLYASHHALMILRTEIKKRNYSNDILWETLLTYIQHSNLKMSDFIFKVMLSDEPAPMIAKRGYYMMYSSDFITYPVQKDIILSPFILRDFSPAFMDHIASWSE